MTKKTDRLALDRATVRTMDVDGRMHVAMTPISKANVCPYYGKEIPNADALGLIRDKVYHLLRHPDELAKAAPTFNGIQLMQRHVPVSATDTQKWDVVGCTGTDAVFEPPYLKNSLAVWDASAIAGIETNEQRELSSSYRYVADMTLGEYEGVRYDGVMRDIVGNHVALVEAGRAGADVLVGDSLPTELNPMKLSKKAVAMRAALGAYLRPRLAQDGALPQLRAIVKGNKKPEFVAMDAKSVFKDADIDLVQLTNVLKLAADEADEDEDDEGANDEEEEEDKESEKEKSKDRARDKAKDRAKDKAKDKAKDEDKDEEDKKGEDEEEDDDEKEKDDRKASDAALEQRVRRNTLTEFRAIREAEEAVRPLVGSVVAMDSAEEVYRYALDHMGIDSKGIHASALPAMVGMAKELRPKTIRVAMDAASAESFTKRFPTATKRI